MAIDIPNTFYWSTEYALADNPTVMCEFIEYYLPEEYNVTYVDGTYAEITKEGTTETYGVHASGNGDFYNHKIEFEEI